MLVTIAKNHPVNKMSFYVIQIARVLLTGHDQHLVMHSYPVSKSNNHQCNQWKPEYDTCPANPKTWP